MKKRIISAIVALGIVIPLLIKGEVYFYLGCAILSILALRELLNLKQNTDKLPILVQLIAAICTVFLVVTDKDSYSIFFGLTYRGLAINALLLFAPVVFYKKNRYKAMDALRLFAFTVFLGLVFNIFILIRNLGLYKFIYLLLITTITDTFAYIFGSLIGKHKMCPSISPKKSWEGAILGSIMGTVIAVSFYQLMISQINVKVVLITLIFTVLGQIGDLFFSKIKRENDIKDFSNIMPGHGGILDRLDSLIFVSLAYVIFISFI